jgi:CheY-like chemotaxis protein
MIEIDMETVPSGAVRILVVEDEILVRLMVSDGLRDLGGALVISAATADEAWDYLVAEDGRVDVVFTDHRMPGSLTGAQFASKVAEHYPNIPVIVTSAFYDGTEWNGPVLPKPYDLDATIDMLVATAKKARGEA